MATLNRFPLFGLWNRVGAEVLGYSAHEARCIGHGVAVLYAIRAQGGGHRKSKTKAARQSIPVGEQAEALTTDDVRFGGDSLPCELDAGGRVARCLVGCQSPQDAAQTPDSYDSAVEEKIPEAHLGPLRAAMGELLETYDERELQGALIYQVYDEWKQDCKAGRRVDLDKLEAWLRERAARRRDDA